MIDLKKIKAVLLEKKSADCIINLTKLLNEAFSSDELILETCSLDNDLRELSHLVRHAESIWNDAVLLLRNGSFASSVFMSIVAMEETGKIAIARFQVFLNEYKRENGIEHRPTRATSPLYSHHKKHQLAAFSGLAVNNRADRILGVNNIKSLLRLVESGSLEKIRQHSIYSRTENGSIGLPLHLRNRQDAIFFCTISGEVLVEVGGVDPLEFERLIKKMDKFEAEFKLEDYTLNLAQ